MRFLWMIVGAVVGLLIVRFAFLGPLEIMAWGLFLDFVGSGQDLNWETVLESSTFRKAVTGTLVGAVVGCLIPVQTEETPRPSERKGKGGTPDEKPGEAADKPSPVISSTTVSSVSGVVILVAGVTAVVLLVVIGLGLNRGPSGVVATTVPVAPEPKAGLSADESVGGQVADSALHLRKSLGARRRAAADVASKAVERPDSERKENRISPTSQSEYEAEVAREIRKNWIAPTLLIGESEPGSLSAVVTVRIHADGALKGESLATPSGNEVFDTSCMKAVKDTGSVSRPPSGSQEKYARGFDMRFKQ